MITMPSATRTLCHCGGIKTGGTCEKCGANARQGHTRTTTERGYDGPWKRVSKRLRTEQPLCIVCWHEGRVTTAEPGRPLHGHHIVKVIHAPELRLERSNVLVVCDACHTALDTLYETNRTEYGNRVKELVRARDGLLGG